MNTEHYSPLCLPDDDDLLMDLTKKSGVTAGWGATAVKFQENQCGWTYGMVVPGSGANVLKKIEGMRCLISGIRNVL